MPQIKAFHPDLQHKLEELFNHSNGKMPCKDERIRLGDPYDESPMRIQCWFTKRTKTRRSRTSDFLATDSVQAPHGPRLLRSERQFQRKLSPVCIEFLERRFMKEGPRLPSEKARQRISETYNVSLLSIEEWWHLRQSTGGKLYSPKKHRGGKLTELEDGKIERIGPRKLSFSHTFSPSNNVFIARSILSSTPSGSIRLSSTTAASSFSEASSPSSGNSRTSCSISKSNHEPASPHVVHRSFSTLSASGLSLSESTATLSLRAKDATTKTTFSSPSHTLGPAFSLSLASPLLLQTGPSASTRNSITDGYAFHLSNDLPCRGPDVILDLDWETVATRRQRERRTVSRSTSYSSVSDTACILFASWPESEAFVEPGGPHWRLVDQDLNAALQSRRNRELWTGGDSSRLGSERRVLDRGLCSTNNDTRELFETGRTAVNDEVEKLLLEYVDCEDDSQRQGFSQRLDVADRRLSRLDCVFPKCPDLECQPVTRPSTPHSNSTPRFYPLSTPTDPGLCSPGSTHASSPCIESPEISPLVYDSDQPVFMKERQDTETLISGLGLILG